MADIKDKAQEQLGQLRERFRTGVYRHFKGGEYVLYSVSLSESSLLPLIHYYSLSKRTRWTRDFANWQSPAGEAPRFSFVREATREELLEACGIE